MSELDLLRRIADLEARLARLESAGTPYTTSGSTGAMNVTRINAITDGSGGGFYAGSASDVQLYRSAADVLRTPDSLTVDTGINVGSATGATTGEVRTSSHIKLTATAARLALTRNTSSSLLDALWYGNGTAPGSSAGDDIWVGASGDIHLYSHSAVAEHSRFSATTGATLYRSMNFSAGSIASGATAPDLTSRTYWYYPGGGSATTIDPVDGYDGQVVYIVNLSTNNLTIGRTNAVLNGSVNQVLGTYDAICLMFSSALGWWFQVAPLSSNG